MNDSPLSDALDLASRQHGLVSAAQLTELKITPSQLRTAVGRGRLARVAPRVYGVVGAPDSLDRRQTAGLLSLGAEAVLSHEAAARLHGFDRCLPDTVEFTVLRRHRGVRAPFTIHTTLVLPLIDRVTVDGYRCTSATRTVIDLAHSRVSRVRLEAAIDSAVRSGASAPRVLVDRLDQLRGRGRWGAALLDELVRDAGGHTLLERRFLTLMREAGLPRPRSQVGFRQASRTYARVDFAFVELSVVVEVSGTKGHSSPVERARDAQRRNELQDVGQKVYEYTFDQVTRQPAEVIRTMRARLRAAGWQPA